MAESLRLSEHFYLSEFLVSETAARHDIDLSPPPEAVASLTRLCQTLLQPIRDLVGPMVITSGYRPESLNRLIGGSRNSGHLYGLAADVRALSVNPTKLCHLIERMELSADNGHSFDPANLDQCILEFNSWCHVSIPAIGKVGRREYLTAIRSEGRTKYLNGICDGEAQ